jgi:hypothetical protein
MRIWVIRKGIRGHKRAMSASESVGNMMDYTSSRVRIEVNGFEDDGMHGSRREDI